MKLVSANREYVVARLDMILVLFGCKASAFFIHSIESSNSSPSFCINPICKSSVWQKLWNTPLHQDTLRSASTFVGSASTAAGQYFLPSGNPRKRSSVVTLKTPCPGPWIYKGQIVNEILTDSRKMLKFEFNPRKVSCIILKTLIMFKRQIAFSSGRSGFFGKMESPFLYAFSASAYQPNRSWRIEIQFKKRNSAKTQT